MSDTVAVPETSDAADLQLLRGLYDPALDFQTLALEAEYFSRGFRLVEKDALIGVPHVVISVTYREGYLRGEGKDAVQGDYVSVEAVVANREVLDSAQVRSQLDGDLTVYPNEAVVYNDGGTGIRREFTGLFDRIGLIDVGGDPADPRRLDRPFSQWESGADIAQAGIVADVNGQKFRYVAMRGLRKSEYESAFGPAVTYYIA